MVDYPTDFAIPQPSGTFGAYCAGGHRDVEGWLEPSILTAITGFIAFQRAAGLPATFAEIGVHHGRFYLGLALAMGASSRGVAIDVFEAQHLNPDGSGKGNRQAFVSNMARLNVAADRQTIIAHDSRLVSPQQVISALGGQHVSIFSVDGAHTVEYTISDLELAAATIAECGIIIVDDLFNARWPGVIDGVLQWLRSKAGTFEMVVYGDNKGFIARSAVASAYRQMLVSGPARRFGAFHPVVFAGRPSLFARFADPRAAFPLGSDAEGAPEGRVDFCKGGAGAPLLGEGWAMPEKGGVWSIRREAKVALPTSYVARAATPLTITLQAFVPDGETQRLTVSAGGRSVFSEGVKTGVHTIMLGREELKRAGAQGAERIELTFGVERLFIPSAFSLGSDNRELGIRLVCCDA
ncbi:hypothetical protein CQW49_23060 (plasmid) [Methylosinus trichosporium OB3b]|uniref:Class I SAM-dependent methyltransferase n=1 Tax=Methylosinus trichosporium (strain ATCC 35070 / NCIMB 11131 / UNIQEM 75 / OB3b) TaxID=595536 RepID=A0A2D2D792_METT3|nr:class I SAM-dependent methyltransferase [Methylosinus trichosporium]ATQ70843.1 hypothetical protein CQW49_23060 [Methylosinus trichosporium OB3b]